MKIGTALFISIGCGLGMGLNGYPALNVDVLYCALGIAIAHIIFKSDNFSEYKLWLIKKASGRGWKDVLDYFIFQFMTTVIIIFLAIIVVQVFQPEPFFFIGLGK